MAKKQEQPWSLALGYDYRFGALRVSPVNPKGESVADFIVRIPDMLRRANIPAHELKAMLEIAAQPETPDRDIEEVRRTGIELCNVYGKTVLDVGGYDGFAAKMTLDRGAKRAICLDNHQYEHYGWEDIKKEGVEYITGDLMEWTEPVDVLINYNVLYHVKNPWAFLAKCRDLTREEMILCTLFRYHDGSWVYLYEPRECNPTDESVFWGPSITALERMLKFTGWKFQQVGLALDRVVYRCWPTEEPQFRQSRY